MSANDNLDERSVAGESEELPDGPADIAAAAAPAARSAPLALPLFQAVPAMSDAPSGTCARKTGQETGGDNRPAITVAGDIGHIGKIAVQRLLILIPERQFPGAIRSRLTRSNVAHAPAADGC